MRSKGLDFETVRQIAVSLPEVKEAITKWGWTIRARGRLLACQPVNRSAEHDSLVVKIGFEDRARLLSAEPEKFYVTDHYAPYPTVLVRLTKISRARLESVLKLSWSFVTSDRSAARRSRGKKKEARR